MDKLLVAGLSLRRITLDPVQVQFLLDKLALQRGFLAPLWVFRHQHYYTIIHSQLYRNTVEPLITDTLINGHLQ
jgi:hypothetical protein